MCSLSAKDNDDDPLKTVHDERLIAKPGGNVQFSSVQDGICALEKVPVSYTHLTLPTMAVV